MPVSKADSAGRTAAKPVSATAYRTLMAAFPAGVAVVTAADEDGQQFGMTCTAVSSVSVSPPTLLVCIQHSSRTLAVLSRTGRFAVNLLDDRARTVAELFASRGPDRFEHVAWTARPGVRRTTPRPRRTLRRRLPGHRLGARRRSCRRLR